MIMEGEWGSGEGEGGANKRITEALNLKVSVGVREAPQVCL